MTAHRRRAPWRRSWTVPRRVHRDDGGVDDREIDRRHVAPAGSRSRIAAQERADAFGRGVAGGDDVGGVERDRADPGGQVGGQREAEHLHPGVTGGDRLQHGRHPDEVGAERRGHADLRRRLEVRSVEAEVHALGEVGVDRAGEVAQPGAVEVGEVDEPGAERRRRAGPGQR